MPQYTVAQAYCQKTLLAGLTKEYEFAPIKISVCSPQLAGDAWEPAAEDDDVRALACCGTHHAAWEEATPWRVPGWTESW